MKNNEKSGGDIKTTPSYLHDFFLTNNNYRMNGENVFDIQNLFSRNLKRLRNEANISQLTLANLADLTHNFINDIENGKKWVSAKSIGKLATALQVEPHQFFLAESRWNEREIEILSTYLDELSDSVHKVLLDYRRRYMPNVHEETDEKKDLLNKNIPC